MSSPFRSSSLSSLGASSSCSSSPLPPTNLSGDARYQRLLLATQDKKRKRDDDSRELSISSLGRGIRKVVDLYTNVSDLVIFADQHEFELAREADASPDEDELEDEEREQRSMDKQERKRAYNSVRLLPAFVPNFEAAISGQPKEVAKFYADLQRGANDARSDDVNKLKKEIACWLNAFIPTPSPLLDADTRDNRGIKHDLCGKLLCPIELDWDDAEVRARIRNGDEGFELGVCPRVLYAGFSGDPENPEDGFLKSMLLVKTYKHIFTSPASAKLVNPQVSKEQENLPPSAATNFLHTAKKPRKMSRKHVAASLHMRRVTPRSIAYAAVQLLFALGCAPQWSQSSEGMDFTDVYYYIVDFFEAVDDDAASTKIAQGLLSWWNRQIFPEAPFSKASKSGMNARKKLAALRDVRKKATVAD